MIPKVIHLCWISGDDYPPKIKKCIDSWKKYLPDYDIQIWDENRVRNLNSKWINQCLEKKAYAFAADYVRFYALYHYGGIYLDSDVEVIRGFDIFLNERFFFGFEYMGTPEAAVVGAEKGVSWINNCLNWYKNNSYLNEGKEKRIIAPLILLEGFEKTYDIKLIDDGNVQSIDGGKVYTYDYFSPKNVYNNKIIKTHNTYAIHHFNSAWFKSGLKVKISRFIHQVIILFWGRQKHNIFLYERRKKNKTGHAYD